MPASTDASNGRVTLAVIGQRLTVIETTLIKIDTTLSKVNDCVGGLTTQSQLNKHRLDSHDGDLTRQEFEINAIDGKLDSLNQRFTWWSGVNSMLAAAAGAIGTIFGVNK